MFYETAYVCVPDPRISILYSTICVLVLSRFCTKTNSLCVQTLLFLILIFNPAESPHHLIRLPVNKKDFN